MKRISILLFLWGVVSAWAVAGAADVVVHPLHIEASLPQATATALKQAFQKQAFKALPSQTSSVDVERFFRQKEFSSCWGDDSCSVSMAKALAAKSILLVSIVRIEPWIIMSARLLDIRGAELKDIPIAVHTPEPDLPDNVNFEDAFSALFSTLEFSKITGASAQAPLTPKSLPPQQGLSSMRVASYATFGVAAAGVVVGTTFLALYFKNHNTYQTLLNGGVSPAENAGEALKYMQRSKDNQLVSIIAYGVGGAALATALTLFFLSPEYQQNTSPAFSLAPLPGGGAFSLSSQF